MKYKLEVSVIIIVLIFGISLLSFAAEEMHNTFRIAALDGKDAPPPCGKDGKCNIAACPDDPDCPSDVPSNPDQYSSNQSSTTGIDEVINCDSTQSKDIRAVAWNIADDWTNFDNAIEGQTSFRLGECVHDRFSKNGKVECMSKDVCNKKGCRQGHASPFKKKVKIYPDFLNQIANLSQADRRACYAALMTHEFTHSCDRMEGRSEAREDAAFAYWTGRFPGTPGFSINLNSSGVGCGLD